MLPHTLRAIFFMSGCSALLFETLWFRQAGLMLGNSVWSSSIVLGSFMAGLAIGNAFAGRWGARLRRPLHTYAALEVIIGLSGLALVATFPLLTRVLAPLLAHLVGDAALLNTTRMTVAFALLLVPASAMGATLPVLAEAVGGGSPSFGRTLGQLYGWNTLGAVAGALAGEFMLIERFGVPGCGAVAAVLNLVAALGARRLAVRHERPAPESHGASVASPRYATLPLLAAAFCSGGILLALEVVWFRFLILFMNGTSAAFAMMLAVVLAGIALGGLVAARWLARDPNAARSLPLVAFGGSASILWTYAAFAPLRTARVPVTGLTSTCVLVLPTCLVSGVLFTLLGDALRRRLQTGGGTAGALTLANTIGAMVGALSGGLVLLPALGIERSFFALSCAYTVVAVLCWRPTAVPARSERRALVWRVAAAGLVLVSLLRFPFGLMSGAFLPGVWAAFQPYDSVVAYREGLTETSAYLRTNAWSEPVRYRLVTNGHSMSGTSPRASRYMRLFSHLPLALNADARSALLISFGVGVTAQALTSSASLESIDVVDISRDILELGRAMYPPPQRYPLDDTRVRVHVEDGRFFLLTTKRTFDVITAEPPPPKHAGIVNLYSTEHFSLIRSRLNEGGIVSYWLPVYQLELDDTRAIARAFCDQFDDCTLWTGFGSEWMLVGTRDGRAPNEEEFSSLWRAPATRRSLEEIGLALPEQLGTTFLADHEQLTSWLADVRPLEDAYPLRLSRRMPNVANMPRQYDELLDPSGAKQRFATSAWVKRMWPASVRERTIARFDHERFLLLRLGRAAGNDASVPEIAGLAGDPSSRTGMLWLMHSDTTVERAASLARERRVQDPELDVETGIAAFVDGRYTEADALFRRAQRHVLKESLVEWRVLALALAGDRQRAAQLVTEAGDWVQPQDRRGWEFLIKTYGLPDPWQLRSAPVNAGDGGASAPALPAPFDVERR